MEAVTFAIGLAPKKTKSQRRAEKRAKIRAAAKLRQKKEENELRVMMRRRYIPPREPEERVRRIELFKKRWLLLPRTPLNVATFLYHAGKGILQILEKIKHKSRIRSSNQVLLKQCHETAVQNQRVRRAFENLGRRWIRSRFRRCNEEDLMTGEVPKNPVILTDWVNRTTHVFEARTIYRDMCTRLQMSYVGQFPKPLPPRNPYTNSDMTDGQFYDIIRQLRAHGFAHWTLEALYSVQYCMKRFEKEMYWKLKNVLLHAMFSSHTNTEGISAVLEFIEDEYGHHRIVCRSEVYEWALENCPTHPHIVAWRNLCYRFYKIGNTIPVNPETEQITAESKILCHLPLKIATQYDAPRIRHNAA